MFKSHLEEAEFRLSRYGWTATFLAILAIVLIVLISLIAWKTTPYFMIFGLLILALWWGMVNLLLRRFREVREKE